MAETWYTLYILDREIKKWVNRDKSPIMHDNIHY